MDAKKGPDPVVVAGIELSPKGGGGGDRRSQPGLEVVDYSDLEVVSPRTAALSHARPWEKGGNGSSLPQVSEPLHQGYEHASLYHHGGEGYAGGGGGGPPARDGFFARDTICGVRRQTFWVVMAVGVFVVVAAIAVGVGLGVALHKSGDGVSSPPPSSSSSTPTTTTLPAPTATGATGPEAVIRCPANNRTLYSTTANSAKAKSFLLLCGRDYSSVDGAVDLFHEVLDSMAECIDECARRAGCTGAGWGPYDNQSTCWLKSKLGRANVTPNWYFAVEDEGALGGGGDDGR